MTTKDSIGGTITVEALEADPYPIYQQLRAEEPISWVESVGLWLVTRWDDVREVDLTPEVFTAETEPSTLNRTFGKNLLGSEGAYHTHLRTIIQPAFAPSNIRDYGDAVITPIANELIDAFVERGEADLMAAFATPLSVRTLKTIIGLTEMPDEQLQQWFEDLATGAANFEADPEKQAIADRASEEVNEMVQHMLDRLEDHPDNTLLSNMLHSEVEGERLTREEIQSNLKVMIVGGMQEPGDLIGIAVWALLSHPDQLRQVAENRKLIRQTVEEILRWYSPVGTSTRQVTRATTLAGVALDEGALIAAVVASANRDERHWTNPERLDIHRREGPHLAFATGPHACVGAPLARREAMGALQALFDRLPNLRLAPDHQVELSGWEFRRPHAVHVQWDI